MARSDSPVENMKAAFAAGDVRRARRIARDILGAEGPGAEEARRILEATAIDRRALVIGSGALALGFFYLVAFILLR